MRRNFVIVASAVALLTTLVAFSATACPEAKQIERTSHANGKQTVKVGKEVYTGRTSSQGNTQYRNQSGKVVATCKERGNTTKCR